MLPKTLASIALMVAMSQTASAADWQYCLAPSHLEHKVYMSATFLARGGLGSADSAFERMLNQASLRHDDVQCPRADDKRSIVIMRQDAITYNQKNGNTIIHLPLETSR
jgi:hypothetical protein